MKVVIFGSRPPKRVQDQSVSEYRLFLKTWYGCHLKILEQTIDASGFNITKVISGKAQGYDRVGEIWAAKQTPKIPVIAMPADWSGLGKAAGMIRNTEMAKVAEAGIGVIINNSRGSSQMASQMKMLKKPVYIVRLQEW